jgi:hypothetical protein
MKSGAVILWFYRMFLVFVVLHGTEHLEYLHRLCNAFKHLGSQVIEGERTLYQPCRHLTDHHGIGPGKPF